MSTLKRVSCASALSTFSIFSKAFTFVLYRRFVFSIFDVPKKLDLGAYRYKQGGRKKKSDAVLPQKLPEISFFFLAERRTDSFEKRLPLLYIQKYQWGVSISGSISEPPLPGHPPPLLISGRIFCRKFQLKFAALNFVRESCRRRRNSSGGQASEGGS